MSLRLSIAAAALIVTPSIVAAQNYTPGYQFLQAVREADGTKVTDILNQPGASVINTRGGNGEGALHIVVRRNGPNDATYLRFLLQKGANPNMGDGGGNTPAMLAVEHNFLDAIPILARYKANMNAGKARGETPLIRAVQFRNIAAVRLLLDAGANPNQTDNLSGMSAIDYARRDGRSQMILKLLEAKPEAKSPSVAGPQAQ